MQERWRRWQPLEELHTKYVMDVLLDSSNNDLLLELSPSELFDEATNRRRIHMFFKKGVFSYSVTDEGKRLRTFQYLSDCYDTGFYGEWTFFIVQSSAYRELMLSEYSGTSDSASIIHYTLICDNILVDILALDAPKVSYIE